MVKEQQEQSTGERWLRFFRVFITILGVKAVVAILIFFHILPQFVEDFYLITLGNMAFILVNAIPIVFLFWLVKVAMNIFVRVKEFYAGIQRGLEQSTSVN